MADASTSALAPFTVRIHDVVRPFSGEGDIVKWLEKVEMVARLRGITDLQNVLPLFLEGPAFAVFPKWTRRRSQTQQLSRRH